MPRVCLGHEVNGCNWGRSAGHATWMHSQGPQWALGWGIFYSPPLL